jgi:hypothetical protein
MVSRADLGPRKQKKTCTYCVKVATLVWHFRRHYTFPITSALVKALPKLFIARRSSFIHSPEQSSASILPWRATKQESYEVHTLTTGTVRFVLLRHFDSTCKDFSKSPISSFSFFVRPNIASSFTSNSNLSLIQYCRTH